MKGLGYTTGLIDIWLIQDGWYSIVVTERAKVNNDLLKDHIIRIIRIALGLALVVIGGLTI